MSLAGHRAYFQSTFVALPAPGYGAGVETQPGRGFSKAHLWGAARVKMAQAPPHYEQINATCAILGSKQLGVK